MLSTEATMKATTAIIMRISVQSSFDSGINA
jgi:hypothetical protein